LENLVSYIDNPNLLGKSEENHLSKLRETYPYFQALHILIAKSHKNQDTFGFNKSLKIASLYAGNRKTLYNFINKNNEPAEPTFEKEPSLEIVLPITKETIIDEPIENLVNHQSLVTEENVFSQDSLIPEPEFIEPPIIKAFEELNVQEKPSQASAPKLSPEQLDVLFGSENTKLPEVSQIAGGDVFESIEEINFRLKLNETAKQKDLSNLNTEKKDSHDSKGIEPEIEPELMHSKPSEDTIQPKVEIVEQKTEEVSKPDELPLVDINPFEETVNSITKSPSIIEISKPEEHDFYSWLDNFTSEKIKETLPESKDTQKQEFIESEKNVILEQNIEESKDIDLSEIEVEDIDDDDLPGLAEIAYDIQAFVKHPEEETKNTARNQVSKEEIDDLLERFINKNPSISRVKTEFYKPENMARKSEEFHTDLVSETLASVFYRQGHLHKSLEIYEKLMLQNPDKNDIFAARIKSIKEELINRL